MKIIAVILGFSLLVCGCARKPVYRQAPVEGGSVKIGLAGLQEKSPEFYTFYDKGKGINYFVLKVDGSVQSYFDACSKCYPKKGGYRLDKDRVDCRTCDVHYSINDLKDGIGSCYPIKLPGRIEGPAYVIDGKDLLAGEKYF